MNPGWVRSQIIEWLQRQLPTHRLVGELPNGDLRQAHGLYVHNQQSGMFLGTLDPDLQEGQLLVTATISVNGYKRLHKTGRFLLEWEYELADPELLPRLLRDTVSTFSPEPAA